MRVTKSSARRVTKVQTQKTNEQIRTDENFGGSERQVMTDRTDSQR